MTTLHKGAEKGVCVCVCTYQFMNGLVEALILAEDEQENEQHVHMVRALLTTGMQLLEDWEHLFVFCVGGGGGEGRKRQGGVKGGGCLWVIRASSRGGRCLIWRK